MKTGIERIAEERKRQIEKEGWSQEHDSAYGNSELVKAAVCYAFDEFDRGPRNSAFGVLTKLWPWDWKWWKPTPYNRIRELEKAGALIASEIDRIQNSEHNG